MWTVFSFKVFLQTSSFSITSKLFYPYKLSTFPSHRFNFNQTSNFLSRRWQHHCDAVIDLHEGPKGRGVVRCTNYLLPGQQKLMKKQEHCLLSWECHSKNKINIIKKKEKGEYRG